VTAPSTSPRLRVIVFTRTPVLGAVKTRLAARIGDRAALEIHTAMLLRTIDAVRAAALARPTLAPEIHYLGPPPAIAGADMTGSRLVPQEGDTLAANLDAILADPGAGGARGCIVIGSDHPTLEPAHILAMADILATRPVCVGPAEDGGFWSIGATVPLSGMMREVTLETSAALDGLRAALSRAGIAWGEGPTLWDLDTAADLDRWRAGDPGRFS
jgi:glycosyltransferase A (GT-A) superfamily protein (DUF2064 family)